jgi:AICAR transformylase/IMP cyclohydrolase PurH
MLRLDAFEIALSQAKRRGFAIKDTVFATDGAILDAELFARVLNSGVRGMVFPSVTKTNQRIAALMAESKVPILLSNHRHFT